MHIQNSTKYVKISFDSDIVRHIAFDVAFDIVHPRRKVVHGQRSILLGVLLHFII